MWRRVRRGRRGWRRCRGEVGGRALRSGEPVSSLCSRLVDFFCVLCGVDAYLSPFLSGFGRVHLATILLSVRPSVCFFFTTIDIITTIIIITITINTTIIISTPSSTSSSSSSSFYYRSVIFWRLGERGFMGVSTWELWMAGSGGGWECVYCISYVFAI